MQPQLAKEGITYRLSHNTAEEAAIHKKLDGLSRPLLSDPNLEVIRLCGLEHQKALSFTTRRRTIAGIPVAFTPSFKTMAIPISMLVDENGIV